MIESCAIVGAAVLTACALRAGPRSGEGLLGSTSPALAHPETVRVAPDPTRQPPAREIRDGESLETAPAIDTYLTSAYEIDGCCRWPGLTRLAERAFDIRQKSKLDPSDPAWIPTLIDLAKARMCARQISAGKKLLDRALEIAETRLPPDAPGMVAALDALEGYEWAWGSYTRAIEVKKRSLAIAERRYGSSDPRVAERTYQVGRAAYHAGDYTTAWTYVQRGIKEMEAAGAASTDMYANALNVRGLIESSEGLFDDGLRDLRASLDLRTRLLGPDASDTGQSFNNLGWLCDLYGDHACAEQMFRKTVQIWSVARRLRDSDTAMARINLGETLRAEGKLEEAARQIRAGAEVITGPDHPKDPYSWEAIRAMAHVDEDEGRFSDASAALSKAWTLAKERFGRESPELAEILQQKSSILEKTGEPEKALLAARSALSICKRDFGEAHPEFAAALALAARIEGRQGRVAAAITDAMRAAQVQRAHLRRTARALPESRALAYAAASRRNLDLLLSLGFGHPSAISTDRLWDAVIRARAVIVEELALRRHLLSIRRDPPTRDLIDRLEKARSALAAKILLVPESGEEGSYRATLAQALDAEERAADALARHSEDFFEQRALAETGFESVAKALPADAALVAYVRFGSASARYAAFVLPRGGGQPERVDLGPAKEIDQDVRAMRNEISRAPGARRSEETRAESRYRAAAARLRDRIWSPVVSLLGNPDRAFLVPSGLLAFVDFAALPVADGNYLIDRGPTIDYLSTERDLTRPPATTRASGTLLAFGGVDFDTVRLSGAGMTARALPALPLTVREIHRIAETVAKGSSREAQEASVVLFEDGDATERSFRSFADDFRIVHIATHGFFLKRDGRAPVRGLTGASENPLYRAGLLFTAPRPGGPVAPSAENDGVLTAAEVASLDLSGVSWVVLSACDTGLGDLQTGEGVLGLRRAFEIAGARSVIMSLWPVDDAATEAWMSRLYTLRFAGASTPSAVRGASRAILEERRASGRSTHPYYWGAFVAAGDWR